MGGLVPIGKTSWPIECIGTVRRVRRYRVRPRAASLTPAKMPKHHDSGAAPVATIEGLDSAIRPGASVKGGT
ncbi:hypothetical protein MMARJ_15190 [Mycobacterium marseillense]|uniref:Uncharacterized protein n=1 Tax=Mycobacterium marseillense TaxID=701042 RepID=A0ABN5ZR95_9MYCO|nr:hypothetical protein MMARJ_15190 [Mycobacterium marseillense]